MALDFHPLRTSRSRGNVPIMDRPFSLLAIGLALAGCSTAPAERQLTQEVFEAAERACAAPEAYIRVVDGERTIAFPGVAPDFKARKSQIDCLGQQLKGRGVRFIVTLTEPPRD